jgi:hypothetical protein
LREIEKNINTESVALFPILSTSKSIFGSDAQLSKLKTPEKFMLALFMPPQSQQQRKYDTNLMPNLAQTPFIIPNFK